jgi:hypothetical protein
MKKDKAREEGAMLLPQPNLGQGSCQFLKHRRINDFSQFGKSGSTAGVSRPGDRSRAVFRQALVLPAVNLSSSGNRFPLVVKVSTAREK